MFSLGDLDTHSFSLLYCKYLHRVYIRNRPDACDENIFMRDGQTRVKMRVSDDETILPVIIKSVVNNKKHVTRTENKVIKPLAHQLIL